MAVGEVRYAFFAVSSMSYNMFLDDIRMPSDVGLHDPLFRIARSMDEALDMIQIRGWPQFVSFDHDLGMKVQEAPNFESTILVATEEEAPTGYDFAKWLCERDQDTPWMKEVNFKWNVHSANPVGAANIEGYLKWYTERFVR